MENIFIKCKGLTTTKSCRTLRMGLSCGILDFWSQPRCISLALSPLFGQGELAFSGAAQQCSRGTGHMPRGLAHRPAWVFCAQLLSSRATGTCCCCWLQKETPQSLASGTSALSSPQSHIYVVHFESLGDRKVHICCSLVTCHNVVVQQKSPTNPSVWPEHWEAALQCKVCTALGMCWAFYLFVGLLPSQAPPCLFLWFGSTFDWASLPSLPFFSKVTLMIYLLSSWKKKSNWNFEWDCTEFVG